MGNLSKQSKRETTGQEPEPTVLPGVTEVEVPALVNPLASFKGGSVSAPIYSKGGEPTDRLYLVSPGANGAEHKGTVVGSKPLLRFCLMGTGRAKLCVVTPLPWEVLPDFVKDAHDLVVSAWKAAHPDKADK